MGIFRRSPSPFVGSKDESSSLSSSRPSDASGLSPVPRVSTTSSSSSGQPNHTPSDNIPSQPTVYKKSKKGKGDDAGHQPPPLAPSHGIAAALLPSTQIATSSAAGAHASPWAGYIDSSQLNRKTNKAAGGGGGGLLGSKKSKKNLKREMQELEPFFPMAKVELEKLDVNLSSGKVVSAEMRGVSGQTGLVKDYDGPARRQEGVTRGATAGTTDFARFSVGGMLDIVDRKMAQEEEEEKATFRMREQGGRPNQPFLQASRSPEMQQVQFQQQQQQVPPSSTFLASRPLKSSQDELEVLSPALHSQSQSSPAHARARTQTTSGIDNSGPGFRASVSSVTSEATTLRDEVLELLEVARKLSGSRTGRRDSSIEGSERGDSVYASTEGERKSLDRMKSTPALRQPLAAKAKDGTEQRKQQPLKEREAWQIINTRVSKPHYGALTLPGSSSTPLIPATTFTNTARQPATHARKRSMSVPSAFHVPPPLVSLASRTGFLHPPKTYDESFFSSPRTPLSSKSQTSSRHATGAASIISIEASSTDGSTRSAPERSHTGEGATRSRMQLKRVPSSTTEEQLHLSSVQQPRLVAGHPGANLGQTAIQQYQYARYLVAPPAWSHSTGSTDDTDGWPRSAPIESEEAKESRRIRSNSDASVIDPFAASSTRMQRNDARSAQGQYEPLRIHKSRPEALQPASLAAASARNMGRTTPSLGLSPSLRKSPTTSLGIGPPPRSPLPSLPPPNLPLPALPRKPRDQLSTGNERETPIMLASRSPSPETFRRAASPAYSKENRARPNNAPVSPPTRPPPAVPVAQQLYRVDYLLEERHDHAIAAKDYAFPPTPTSNTRLQMPSKKRPDTAQTMESIASYYSNASSSSDMHTSTSTPSLVHYASSSTLSSSAMSTRPSLSLDGSHDTHFSTESAITEEEEEEESEEEVRGFESPTSKSGRGRFGWSRNRGNKMEDDEGYLGSPEQGHAQEVSREIHDRGYEYQHRQKSSYTVPIKHARSLDLLTRR